MIEQSTAIRCPSCGAPVKNYGDVCEYCGTRVVRKEDAFKPVYIPVETSKRLDDEELERIADYLDDRQINGSTRRTRNDYAGINGYLGFTCSNYINSNYCSSIIVSNFSNCIY